MSDYYRNIKGDWDAERENEIRTAIDSQKGYKLKLNVWRLFAFDMSYPRPLVAKWASVIEHERKELTRYT